MPQQSPLAGGVDMRFPPPCRPGEPLPEPTGTTTQRQLQPYCERFVYSENSPDGLGEAASSKNHIRFQYLMGRSGQSNMTHEIPLNF